MNVFELTNTHRKPIFILLSVFLIGELGLSISATQPIFVRLIPLNILFTLGFVFYYHERWTPQQILAASVVAITGLAVEIWGVNTGVVFGNYTYSNVLGVKFMNTPIILGANWLLLIYCVFAIINKVDAHWIHKCSIGAFIMVVFDLFLEPIAIKFNMWTWQHYSVPFQNYLAWFVISFLLLAFLFALKFENKNNRYAIWAFAIQMAFFIDLNLIRKLFD